jgi:hypothetical protein
VKDKGKFATALFLTDHNAMKGRIGEWRYSAIHSLTSTLEGGEWSASRHGCFIPRERASDTHWIGGWMGTRTVLDAVVKRKIPRHDMYGKMKQEVFVHESGSISKH